MALAALTNCARFASLNPGYDGYCDGVDGKDWNMTSILVLLVLDPPPVKTPSLRHKIVDKAPRPFGLEDCPEYYRAFAQHILTLTSYKSYL